MANTFDWIEIRTRNLEKASEFYGRLFGWKVIEKTNGSDYWIFDTGAEPRIHNIRRGGLSLRSASKTSGVFVYIHVDNIERILNKARELGGRIILPKTPQGPAFSAFFADPEGNVFGLWEEFK